MSSSSQGGHPPFTGWTSLPLQVQVVVLVLEPHPANAKAVTTIRTDTKKFLIGAIIVGEFVGKFGRKLWKSILEECSSSITFSNSCSVELWRNVEL